MKCPNCGKDLWFVKDVCPFCRKTIASKAQASPESSPLPGKVEAADGSDGFVTLMKCGTLGEADALRTQLAGAGIEAVIPDESLMQAVAWPMSTYGYVRVQVRSTDHSAAREFLASSSQSPAAELATLPLSTAMRCFAFFMPVLFCPGWMIFAIARNAYIAQGCDRKAQELWQCFAAGFVLWLVASVIALLLMPFWNGGR